MNNTRMLFLYTGGTIGMVSSPRGFEPGADVEKEIAALLRDRADITFDFHQFDRLIDSSNATPANWQQMVDHLRTHRGEYDAFIVLHGTNTLAHSAAAVSYALTDFVKPVVFTGSQVPFGIPGTDAPSNVLGAVRAVTSGTVTSVALFFDDEVIAGTRATKTSAVERHGFISPNSEPLSRRSAAVFTGSASGARGWQNPAPYQQQDIVVVTAVPGLTAERFRAMTTPAPDAVIVRTYGVGEGPSDEPGLAEAVGELVSAGTPTIVVSQCQQSRIDLTKYAAGEFLQKVGAIGAEDMTFEAVFTKLTFLLSQGVDAEEMANWITTDLAGELTSPAK
jgi:L-asparaginase